MVKPLLLGRRFAWEAPARPAARPASPPATVLARPELVLTIAEIAAAAGELETGGPLLGRVQRSWNGRNLAPLVSILGTVPPGPLLDGRRASVALGRDSDGERAASALRWLRDTTELELVHVGDWHAHPSGYCEASEGDWKTARRLQDASAAEVWIVAVAVSRRELHRKIGVASGLVSFQEDVFGGAELRFHELRGGRLEVLEPTFSTAIPQLPPLPWHITNPARFACECRLLAAAGYRVSIEAPKSGPVGLKLRLEREDEPAFELFTGVGYPKKAPELYDGRGLRLALRRDWAPDLFLIDALKEVRQ